MGKSFEQAVLRLRPDWGVAHHHFYVKPVGRILCGFTDDPASGGDYIWRYAFALYNRATRITLSLGERLPYPQGFLERAHRMPKEKASEFLRRVAPFEAATYSLQDPETLRRAIELSAAMGNLWV